MKKVLSLVMVICMVFGFSALVYAGAKEGTYHAGKKNIVTVEFENKPSVGELNVIFTHNGETKVIPGVPDPDERGTVKKTIGSVTFNDGKQYKIWKGGVYWSREDSEHWSEMQVVQTYTEYSDIIQ